jgi:3-phosphoshikimate 1-carboxyvinyltransferase
MVLRGRITVPGDKSISHRALLIASISQGFSVIQGFSSAHDCLATLECCRKLGAVIEEHSNNTIVVHGKGLFSLKEPQDILDCKNSGTTMRLLSGILAGQEFFSVVTGDSSLRSRPMGRVVLPMRQMGAVIQGRKQGNLPPLAVEGGGLEGITYTLPVASGQVKSAILLAGLFAEGITTVIEPVASRDHTEQMLAAFGAEIERSDHGIVLKGKPTLYGQTVQIPGDISSAAFFMAPAAVTPGSDIVVEKVGLNPTRTGVLDVLQAMGAHIELENVWNSGGELQGDVRITGQALRGITMEGNLIPRLIDEIPIIAVIATQAAGKTVIRDAGELRVKESNRLAVLARELGKLGAQIRELPDGLEIVGPTPLKGGIVQAHGDHRIAMSLEIASLFSSEPVIVQGRECIRISFPEFYAILDQII